MALPDIDRIIDGALFLSLLIALVSVRPEVMVMEIPTVALLFAFGAKRLGSQGSISHVILAAGVGVGSASLPL